MQGALIYNKSSNNTVRKQLEFKTPILTLHFKDESEIINPTVYIARDTINMNHTINYLYVEDLHRYYFINDVTLEQQRYVLHCHVDVLTTYQNTLYNQSAIIERNAERYNMYLDDSEVLLFNMTRTETFKWDNGFDVTEGDASTKTASYLLVLNGSGDVSEPETSNNNEQGGNE